MPPSLPAVTGALLVIHYLTKAVLIGSGLVWLATGLGIESDLGGDVPAAMMAILSFSIAWQSFRLVALTLPIQAGQEAASPGLAGLLGSASRAEVSSTRNGSAPANPIRDDDGRGINAGEQNAAANRAA